MGEESRSWRGEGMKRPLGGIGADLFTRSLLYCYHTGRFYPRPGLGWGWGLKGALYIGSSPEETWDFATFPQ